MKPLRQTDHQPCRAARLVPCLAGLVLMTAGCADIGLEEENSLGDAYAAEIERQVPLVTDPLIAGYVDSLGRAIVQRADRADRDWHFYVVNDPNVNAFAIPGGHIFVNRGLIDRAGSPSELAGVLGHEIAHVTQRHSVQQMQSRQKANVVVTLFCWLTDVCASTAAQVAINVGGQVVFAKHSRADEAEADSVGIDYLIASGIDPRGVPRMFERLMEERKGNPTVLDAWFGTHPLAEDRIARTRQLVQRALADAQALPPASEPDSTFLRLQENLRALPTVESRQ